MKKLALSLFGGFLALTLSLGLTVIPVIATSHEHEEEHHHEAEGLVITFSSRPRFPVAGKEAEFIFNVSHDGVPEEGRQVMVMVTEAEEGENHGHHHSEEAHAEEEETATEMLMATEISPGVYAVKHVFEKGGKYAIAAQLGEDAQEFAVAVRSRPVAWSLVIGMVALTVGVAGAVAVRKTVKKEW
jgi:hypothetical protein